MDAGWAAMEFGDLNGAAGGGSMGSEVAGVSWGVLGSATYGGFTAILVTTTVLRFPSSVGWRFGQEFF